MITIHTDFNIEENAEYQPMIDDNGILSFVPVHQNVFVQNPDYDFKAAIRQMNLTDNGKTADKERVW